MLRGTGFGKDFRFQTNISPRVCSLSELAGLSARNDTTLWNKSSDELPLMFWQTPLLYTEVSAVQDGANVDGQ